MLTPDGILVVASPYTWRPEYTPLENWIGGFQKVESQDEEYIDDIVLKDAENHFTVDGLKETLMPGLVLLQELKVLLSLKFLKLSLNPSKSLLINSLKAKLSQVPFVIPDADGTFQYTYSNCTVFGAPRKI